MIYRLAAHPVRRALILGAALTLGAGLAAGDSALAAGPHGFAGGGARGFGGAPHAAFGAGPRGFAARGGRVPGYAWRGYGWRGYGWGPGWGLYWGLGLYLPVLPLYYSTYWWDGVPYYYANNDYYEWNPSAGQYEAVVPPAGLTQQAGGASPGTPGAPAQNSELFAYPKNGQSPEQQATDKQQCRAWARTQISAAASGDPSAATDPGSAAEGSVSAGADTHASAVGALQQAVGGAASAPATSTPEDARAPQRLATAGAAQQAPPERDGYLRAEAACLMGRGYSVQ